MMWRTDCFGIVNLHFEFFYYHFAIVLTYSGLIRYLAYVSTTSIRCR